MRRRYMGITHTIIPNLITINQTITNPYRMVSGDINSQAIQWIRQNSHIYLCKYNSGVMYICQLGDSNSNYYYDGTSAVLTGDEGDVMMKLPTFFTKAEEVSSDIWDISFSTTKPDYTWMEWGTNDLIGVYEGYVENSMLYSKSGVVSIGNISQEKLKTYARNRGDGFTLTKWRHQNIMAFLYYAMYGNTHCQNTIGFGTSFWTKATGATDALGMTDTVAGGNGDSNSIKFWGLENWWGNKLEWVDNVVVNPESANGLWRITEDDGTTRDVQGIKMNGYPTKMIIGQHLDVIPKGRGSASASASGYCDYVYTDSEETNRVVRRSGDVDSSACGVATSSAVYDDKYGDSHDGARLVYHGGIIEVKNVSEFKQL